MEMSERERIIKIMEKEGLNPSKFAEAIGLQRAAMSHIVSGRNNPSLEVIKKVLSRYPSVSSDWLISGKGEMYRDRTTTELNFFGNTLKFEDEDPVTPEYRKENDLNQPANTVKQPVKETVIIQEKPSKKIAQIMVIYSDNSFETFIPEKQEKNSIK